MPRYAVGDVQGCFRTFERLLEKIEFDPDADELWFVGDLVNRGPDSLSMLRWAVEHDECITVVLGNHDLHLLARHAGLRKNKSSDTLEEVIEAEDAEDLIEWLRHRPLLHRDGDFVLVHAGLLPAWTVDEAEQLAGELERAFRDDDYIDHLHGIYARTDTVWDDVLEGADRLDALVSVFTRIRTCTAGGAPVYDFAGAPDAAPEGLMPWFDVPGRNSADHTIVFGHWAALDLHIEDGIVGTDSGCVWGGELTAVRLPDLEVLSVPNAEES